MIWQTGLHTRQLTAASTLLLLSLAIVHADDIKVYRVPKERPPARELPAGHPPMDDGHAGHGHAARATPKISYTAPEGWHELGAGDMRAAGFQITGTNGQVAQVAVTPLPGMAGKEALIVNMWRQQMGLDELSPEETTKQLADVDIGGQPGKMFDLTGKTPAGITTHIITAMMHRGETSWFFKLQGDVEVVAAQKSAFVDFLKSVRIEEATEPAGLPAGHPPIASSSMPGAITSQQPPKPRDGGPSWTVPAGWKEIDGGQFLFAKFVIAGDAGAQATVNISVSAGDGGGLLANINRWRGQLGQGGWSEAELQKNAKEIEVAGGKATYTELSGKTMDTDQPATTLGAKVTRDGRTWYYKLMGEPKLVAAQKENFLQFVKGVKY